MNYSTVILLVNKAIRAVQVTYEDSQADKPYTFKTFDPSIAIGDLVVVPSDTRHKMTICKVVATDVDVDFDDAAIQLKWIVQRVDRSDYDRVIETEERDVAAIRSAEIRRKREDLAEKLVKDNPSLAHLDMAALTAPAITL